MSKGLEALKVLVMSSTTIFNTKEQIDESVKTIEQELKALEIIKEKPQATLWLIQHCDKEMEYEDILWLFKEDITKEQFDLLKEVMLCKIYTTNFTK